MAIRHKVFISYHHANDQGDRDLFEGLFSAHYGSFISKSVQLGGISTSLKVDTVRNKIRDEYLRDATVTIVLIGAETWKRKHVDWEISSSIRETLYNSRSGLLGILLPTHPSYGQPNYDRGIVPPRLVDNEARGFANIYNWSNAPETISHWIDHAFDTRDKIHPDNSYPHFTNNKFGARWAT